MRLVIQIYCQLTDPPIVALFAAEFEGAFETQPVADDLRA